MELISNSPEAVARAFVDAINRHDPEALFALMMPSHCMIDALGNRMEGRENLRPAWAGYFRMVPDYEVAIEETFSNGPTMVMLGVARGTYTRDGQLRPENRWQTPLAVRACVKDGMLDEWRIYADNEPMRRLMANGG
jgi:ketosteroid isomerase-like protein